MADIKNKEFKDWLSKWLRRGQYRDKDRKQVVVASRVSRGKYKCATCGNIFPPKEIFCDHIEPVVNPETGFTTWDDQIERLFCPADGLQMLCKDCHSEKSASENQIRRENK